MCISCDDFYFSHARLKCFLAMWVQTLSRELDVVISSSVEKLGLEIHIGNHYHRDSI